MQTFRPNRPDRSLYLVGITVVLNVATAGSALVVVEVVVGEGDGGEVLPAGAEPASAGGVGSLSAAGTAHVVDDGVHVDVDLWVDTQERRRNMTNQHLASIRPHPRCFS